MIFLISVFHILRITGGGHYSQLLLQMGVSLTFLPELILNQDLLHLHRHEAVLANENLVAK
jgi:hypothetical protein